MTAEPVEAELTMTAEPAMIGQLATTAEPVEAESVDAESTMTAEPAEEEPVEAEFDDDGRAG